jgi:putative sterol carrier protein
LRARPFFEGLSGRIDEAKVARIDHSYFFDVAGEGRWLVEVRDGKLAVEEVEADGDAAPADVSISLSGDTFEKIATGRQNPATAVFTGKVKIKGDMAAAVKLQDIFS